MKVYQGDPREWGPGPERGSGLTIGVFDGVHRGHRALLEALSTDADHVGGLETVVVTFDIHPRRFLDPRDGPALLVPLPRRLELLEAAGVDRVGVLSFENVRHLDPEQFIRMVVVGAFNARLVVVGEGFRYGAGRSGDVSTLTESGTHHGFGVRAEPLHGGVSSSSIRRLVQTGDVREAARMLGRFHALPGTATPTESAGGDQLLEVAVKAPLAIPGPGTYRVSVERAGDTVHGRCRVLAPEHPLRVRIPDNILVDQGNTPVTITFHS